MNTLEPINKALRLESERLLLRPVTKEDTDAVLAIRNSEYVKRNFFYRKDITKEEHLNFFHKKCETGIVFYFVVTDKSTDRIIGVVYLQHYEEERMIMESGLFFDEASPKGKGYATEAYRLLADYAFEDLGLKRLSAQVIAYNKASLRLHEKLGYAEVDRGGHELIPSGEEVEAVTFELSREKFYEKN
ncbi:MAG: GNAT family N-acetyltransferase [Lachnospiraceae bacterium]|nr:GNAT family N-acetyltransferase [Lachnospiraceae bacterium]